MDSSMDDSLVATRVDDEEKTCPVRGGRRNETDFARPEDDNDYRTPVDGTAQPGDGLPLFLLTS